MVKDLRCYAEIDLQKLAANYRAMRKLTQKHLIAVVKANAYGHGAFEIANALEEVGAEAFAVACIEEGIYLREKGIRGKLLILGYTPAAYCRELLYYDLIQSVFSLDYAEELAASVASPLPVFIKLDSGMNRLGFKVEDYDGFSALRQLTRLKALGVFSHLAASDSPDERQFTLGQIDKTKKAYDYLQRLLPSIKELSIAGSDGAIRYHEARKYGIRTGLALYGLCTTEGYDLTLLPIMTLKARLADVREIGAGESISYGRTYFSSKPMKIATVTVGYADGYSRQLSNIGVMSVNGHPSRVVGRVTMDQTMLDVTDISAKRGDTVTVLGGEGCTVLETAKRINAIAYEITTGISSRVKRLYI